MFIRVFKKAMVQYGWSWLWWNNQGKKNMFYIKKGKFLGKNHLWMHVCSFRISRSCRSIWAMTPMCHRLGSCFLCWQYTLTLGVNGKVVICEYVCFTCFIFLFKISLRSGRAVQVFQLLPVARQDLSIVQLQGSTEGATEFKIFMTFLQMIKLKGPKILKAHYSRWWFLLKWQIAVLRVPHF